MPQLTVGIRGARIGSDGDSIGCHLPSGVQNNGASIDPEPYPQGLGVPI